jgi:hypothetical protein
MRWLRRGIQRQHLIQGALVGDRPGVDEFLAGAEQGRLFQPQKTPCSKSLI